MSFIYSRKVCLQKS